MDINAKALRKHAFRVSKVRGETASRIRIPGGVIDARDMVKVVEIAEKFGNGTIYLTNRQGIEIPGIKMENICQVEMALQSIIEDIGTNQGDREVGYPSSGTRNIVACPGKRLCPFGCYDTTEFARKMEKNIFPNDLHVKVAFTGCSNDCAKVRMDDFGILGQTMPQYNPDRCVTCEACVKGCKGKSVGALKVVNGKIVRDEKKCVGCGVCVEKCPTRAWTRSKEHYFRLVILGRTGKRNPRLAVDFLKWTDEESILKIVKNVYAFAEKYIDPNAPDGKEHIGYIADRAGIDTFMKYIMEGVELPATAEVSKPLYWNGPHFDKYGT